MPYAAEGPTWSSRLEYLGQKSASDKKIVFNNLGHYINVETLTLYFNKLDGMRAVGIDGVTKEMYGKELQSNLAELVSRIRKCQYRPKPSRIVEIPKDDGSTRPLAISCLEDKIVQTAIADILSRIYEPLFYSCSYGFRAKKSAHDALKAVNKISYQVKNGAVVEVDLKSYFNTIPHEPLMAWLGQKISDKRFLFLIEVMLKAPTMWERKCQENTAGAPQGSILSPVVANIYLHHVVDEWFAAITQSHFGGRAHEIRYADDLVFYFENTSHAEKFYRVLPKRLEKYGLKLHLEKSQMLKSGPWAAERAKRNHEKMGAFKFLGFTCYWGLSKNRNFWRLKFKSRSDRMRKTLKRIKVYLLQNLATNALRANQRDIVDGFIRMVRGWLNYHAISDNNDRVNAFLFQSKQLLLRWFNRRGSKKMNWDKLNAMLERNKYPMTYKVTPMW